MANHLRPQTVFVRADGLALPRYFILSVLAGHFKSITDKLRLLNLPLDLSSLCRLREDTGWGLAVDTAKLIFISGVAAHI